ncbi:uncharacterized protein LOC125240760 isoform X2 [Leguminivora glycinivorella]|uniref:uncharacterized protein LOC125240760 isoform X2 n=1 Tax=Leguminivora glycinivorella TaxID=1035111 RepID=UPI00200E8C09|nr:uncharacterized protein LOC125240760 isoform X2 [Leguminivora glycinivorella]
MRERIPVFKMADDFDKETPDLMEKQVIMENELEFSVTVIKKEVLNFYDSEFESTTSSVQDRKPYLQEEIPDNKVFQDQFLNSNKIILGSKPNIVYDDGDHLENSVQDYPPRVNDEFFEKDPNFNPDSIDENYFEELVTSYEPKVELLDIQSYLHKSRRYCDTCGILFPELNAFEKHVQVFHKETDFNEHRVYKCTFCDKKCVSLNVLKKHIINMHTFNNGKLPKVSKHRRVFYKPMRQHRCTICSKKFVAPHVLKKHLINIHKINYEEVPHQSNPNTKTNIDSQIVNQEKPSGWSINCFHCKKTFDTQKCLIEHLYDILQMKRKNTEIVPVLKSILFKCNKCDIHFTTSQFAANHTEHMEMLINWKCTICNRIFKKEDALSHERQHSVSNNFVVYNMENVDVTKILYKCSKCEVLFAESSFLYHFRDCGLEVSKFIYCKICNMSLDYNLKTSHESDHMEPNYRNLIIKSDVISDNPVKTTTYKYQANNNSQKIQNPFREVKVVLEKIDSNKINKCNVMYNNNTAPKDNASGLYSTTNTTERDKNKEHFRQKRHLTYYYCGTCKCFVSKLKRKIHLEARCKKMTKETCERCGLTFTTASMLTHRSLHKERKDLTLKSFKFFNLYDGQSINPAMPGVVNTKRTAALGRRNMTYYYCETCQCFSTKFSKTYKFHKRRMCKKITKATCKHCGLTFTTASIMTHTRLHEERKGLTVKNFKLFNLYNGQPIDPPVPESIILKQLANNGAETEHTKRPVNNGGMSKKINLKYYFCETCKCSVTNFKKNVHLEARCKDLNTSICKYCGLTFTTGSMTTHMRLHQAIKGLTFKSFKFFNLFSGLRISPPIREVTNLNPHVDTLTDLEPNSCEQTSNKQQELQIDNNESRFCFTTETSVTNQEKVVMCRKANLTYYYCETCKCCVRKTKRNIHLKALCKRFPKVTCKHCGMSVTAKSLTAHMRLHEENSDLSLKNFKIFNLYNGLRMRLPVPDNTSIKGNMNNAASVEKNKGSAKNKKNWKTRRNFTYYYCETCKCSVTKFKKDFHLEARCSKITKIICELCGLMFTKQSMITHRRLHEEKSDLSLKNLKFFNLYNGKPMDPPVLEVAQKAICYKAELVNVKQPTNVTEAKNLCVIQHNNDEDNLDNINRPVNIEGTYLCSQPSINNETDVENINRISINQARNENDTQSINTIADVDNLICPVNNEAIVSNTKYKYLSNIQATVESIIGLVNSNADVECVTQSANIEAENLNILHPSSDHIEIENVKKLVNNETDNLKGSLSVETSFENLIRPIKNYTKLENLVHLTSEAEDVNTKLPLNFKASSDNNAQYESIDLHEENEVEASGRPTNVGSTVAEIERPVSYDDDNDMRDETEYIELTVDFEPEDLKTTHLSNVHIEADFENCIKPINNNSRVENLVPLTNSEVEDTNLELPSNWKAPSESKAQDESINQYEENEVKDIGRPTKVESSVPETKRSIIYDDDNNISTKLSQTYYYCKTCKCFVTQFRKNTHIKARCKNLAKTACKHCGLTFTNGSIMTHLRLHEKMEDFTLNHFKFVNLFSGQPMSSHDQDIKGFKQSEDPVITNKTQLSPNESEALHSKIHREADNWRTNINMILYYCETCECLVTKSRKGFHLKARCKNIDKVTCESCGLTITKNSIETHICQHKENKDLTLNNFKIYNLQNGQPMNSRKPEELNKKLNVPVKATNEAEIMQTKQPLRIEGKRLKRNLKYYFCETCKCFVSIFTQKVHLQAQCNSLSKITCKLCSLRFTAASMKTHKRLHKENKDLSVNNFKLYDLYSGRPIDLPMPKLNNRKQLVDECNLSNYFCVTCKCFEIQSRKSSHIQDNCINITALPCKYCGLKFSSSSFELHNRLHEERKNLTLKNFKFFDLHNGQPRNPPLPDYPKCTSCAVHFLTVTAKNNHICNDVSSLTCHICEIKLSEAAFKLHMSFHQYITDNTKVMESKNSQSTVSVITSNLDQITDKHETENNEGDSSKHECHQTELHTNDATLLNAPDSMEYIVYTCRNCSVSVDTYDKAVEHSQSHYESEENVINTIVCNICNLNIDEECYKAHQTVHEKGILLKLLHFDSYYLPADNNLWIKHIFEKCSSEEIINILSTSIYRFECRIKMDVIQHGDPTLTVYKCNQCNCFIEPSSLFKHSENACFKLRYHPCTICSIPFNSSASRIEHEKIHNRLDISMQSYRIVVFNRERDLEINRSFCLRKNHVLYKCRNCNVIISKLQDIHKCDFINVKQCPDCALLLNMEYYESHMNMHKEFVSFNYSNMKVILIGEANSLEMKIEMDSKFKFKGAVYDYRLFVCNACEICIKNEDVMPKHICRFGKQRSKCIECGLYFSAGRLKTHTKSHEQDPHFLRSNMYIIPFDPCTVDKNKNDTKLYTKDNDSDLSASNTDTDSDAEILRANENYTSAVDDTIAVTMTSDSEPIEEEIAKLYKCTCQLHFLNVDSISRHFGVCKSNPKIPKLKCQKCDLLFTPNVLFTHILTHHNNNGRRFKYDIIEIDCNQTNMIQ